MSTVRVTCEHGEDQELHPTEITMITDTANRAAPLLRFICSHEVVSYSSNEGVIDKQGVLRQMGVRQTFFDSRINPRDIINHNIISNRFGDLTEGEAVKSEALSHLEFTEAVRKVGRSRSTDQE